MRRIAAILLVLMIALAVSPVMASGTLTVTTPAPTATTGTATQGSMGTAKETVATSSTAADPSSTPATASKSSTESNTKAERGVAVVILVVGALALLVACFFYNGWRRSYERLAGSALSITDRFPKTEFNPVETAVFRASLVEGEDAPTQEGPLVEGPSAVAVGTPTLFKASTAEGPVSCTWAVEPPNSATVQPETGTETKLTALQEGAIALKATIGSETPTVAHLVAVAETKEGGIPLLGVGFAGVAATTIAFTVAGALTALNIISGTAFIAFLGPVVGYFFASAHNSPGQGGATGAGNGSGS